MNYVGKLVVVLSVAVSGFASATAPFAPVVCEGDYAGHLQGVCTNERDAIYWSFTTELVKTDRDGNIQKSIPVPYHHGDLCYKDGRVYVAVNLGNFNNPKGNADSWVYVYDEKTLELLAKHEVQEVFHGAGGMDAAGEHFFVVGGLPKGVEENYVYEYDGQFNFVKKHTLASGWTSVGIQSAAFHDGQWWFGCYGNPPTLLRANPELDQVERFAFDCALGIVGIAQDRFLVAKGWKDDAGRYGGELVLARPDATTGLAYLEQRVSARGVEATGQWNTARFRFAAADHQRTTEDGASLAYTFTGTGVALRLGGHDTPPYGPVNRGNLAVSIDGTPADTIAPRGTPREIVLAEGLAPGEHTVRVTHQTNNNTGGVRVESLHSWEASRGHLNFTVSGEENAFLTDCRAILRRGDRIVRNDIARNWLTGQCALAGLLPGDNYTLEVRAVGWKPVHTPSFTITAGEHTTLAPIFLERDPATVIERFRFPRMNQPAIRTAGESFRARFMGFKAQIDEVRLSRRVGPATISRAAVYADDPDAAYYYDREGAITLPEDMPPGVYDLSITVSGDGRDGVCRSPRSVHVVAAYPEDPVLVTFGHLDTSGQYQAEYLEQLVGVTNLIAPDAVLCSTACNPAYVAGALAGLDAPFAINFGNHQFPGHEAWFGDPVHRTDFGTDLSILNFGHPWHVGAAEADRLLSERPDGAMAIISAFEPNAPVELLDRHQVPFIHDAHGPGARVATMGATPTQRAGKLNSESFRVIRFRGGKVVECTYNGHKEAQIPFKRGSTPPIRVVYAQPNDGTHAENTATVTNDLLDPYPNGRVTFVLPKGDYTVDGGRLASSILSDDGRFTVLTARADIPESRSAEVHVAPAPTPAPTANAERPPNILLILTDDQGWGDLGVHNNDVLQTPRLDALANTGTRFNHFYVSPVCAPTRASLLTGRYHLRTNVTGVTGGREVMLAEEVTLAEALKEAGYATGCFGKWHNGGHFPHDPNGQGFDEFFGFSAGHWNNYFDTHYEHNGKRATAEGYINDVFTDKALTFIEDNQDLPFFCYVPYNTPHSPFQAPDAYFDKYKAMGLDDTLACVYGMCENLDDNVGRLIDKLDALGLRENTIVLYLGDNGPNTERYNGGMRGRKGTVHEGGVRNMLLMNGPGLIPDGQVVEPVTAHIDLFPTLLGYAGAPLPEGVTIDGRDLRPLIGDPDTDWPERDYFSFWRHRAALRTADYRLTFQKDRASLFDLRVDPGETVDIAPLKPLLFEELKRRYAAWHADVTDGVPLEPPPVPVGHPERPTVELLAPEGYPEGAITYKVRAGWANDWFTNWTDTDSQVYWDINNVRAGDYAVTLKYTCPEADVGARIEVSNGTQSVQGTIAKAHPVTRVPSPDRVERKEVYERIWATKVLGVLSLSEGTQQLTVRALSKPGAEVMELKSVILERKEG